MSDTPALPGPVDREHFLDAQARARRAGRRAALVAPLAAVAAGVPLCVLVTPALYLPLLVVGHVANAVGWLPPAWWQALQDAAHLLPDAWAQLGGDPAPVRWGFLVLLLVVPGALVMLAAWLVLRVALRESWVGGALRRLRARRPDPAVFEERRLANLAGEIAVAAAVPPPRVLVADLPSANAIVLGRDMGDATIVVTRGLLDTLGRAEQQAVIAHSVASVANGDLRLASAFMSVFHAWGLLGLLTDATLTPRDRRSLREVVRAVRRPAGEPATRRARRKAADALITRATLEGSTFSREGAEYEAALSGHPLHGCLVQLPLLLTLGVASIVLRVALELGTTLVFGPPMAWLWRTRRRLADATAVELTRDPDALASAVRKLVGPPGVTPEALGLYYLGFVRTTKTPQSLEDVPERSAITDYVVGMQPDPEDRLARLQALGAWSAEVPEAARTPRDTLADVRRVVLWGLAAVALAALLLVVDLVTTAALLWLVWTLLAFVFVTVPGRVLRLVG